MDKLDTKLSPSDVVAEPSDGDRRRVLRALSLGGAALLLPLDAIADGPEPEPPTVPSEGTHGVHMGPRFASTRGSSDRARRPDQSLPAQRGGGSARVAVDVSRSSSGDITVEWGSAAFTVGSGASQINVVVGPGPGAPAARDGKTTFELKIAVEVDSAGSVSVITPGGDPQ